MELRRLCEVPCVHNDATAPLSLRSRAICVAERMPGPLLNARGVVRPTLGSCGAAVFLAPAAISVDAMRRPAVGQLPALGDTQHLV
ncbi:hypothetical protein MRX96_037283 [Rhipicephalus microplus]